AERQLRVGRGDAGRVGQRAARLGRTGGLAPVTAGHDGTGGRVDREGELAAVGVVGAGQGVLEVLDHVALAHDGAGGGHELLADLELPAGGSRTGDHRVVGRVGGGALHLEVGLAVAAQAGA